MRTLHHDFLPDPLRLTPLAAIRCYGPGGGQSSTQQSQEVSTTNTQVGASDTGVAVSGSGNTIIQQSQDAATTAAALDTADTALKDAANIAAGGIATAATAAADAERTSRTAILQAGGTAGHAINAIRDMGYDVTSAARDLAAGGYDLASSLGSGAFDLAYSINDQNTGLLRDLAAEFGAGFRDFARQLGWTASDSIAAQTDLAETALGEQGALARDVVGAASDAIYQQSQLSAVLNKQVTDFADNAVSRMADLQGTIQTGGATDREKTSQTTVIALAAAVAVIALFSRGK